MLAIHAEEGEGSGQPSEPQPTPSPDQSFHEEQLSDIPSSSQPQKTQKHRKGRKLSNRVLDLEKAMTAQAKEIAILKKRVKKLEKRKRSRTQGLKLLSWLISEDDDFDVGLNVVRDEGIIMLKEIRASQQQLLEDDESFTVGKLPLSMSVDIKRQNQLFFEDVEESAKEQREAKPNEEPMRLQAEQEAEHAEQIHLDRLLAQRIQEEQEMTEQQKKRQRKKFFAEQRAQARRNRPMTQTQQRTYMSTYLKHQGSWTFAQLKKAKYERLVRSIANFVPMGAKVKRFSVTESHMEEVDYEILDQRSPIIAWNFEYYGPKSLHDEVEVPKEINMNVLVIDKYQDEIPEGFDLILWGDLTTMFHPNEEDDF
ncbi:hypothetical protein Tco_0538714 [Tanacetum coccineum]